MEMNNDATSGLDDALNQQRLRSRARRRRLTGMHVGIAVALFLALVFMINLLSMQHYRRFDWSRSNQHTALSGKTATILTSLQQPANITVFMQPDHELYHAIYEDTVQLLRAYEAASGGRLTVERIDPDRHPGRAEELVNRFSLPRINVLVVEYAGRFNVIELESLAVVNYLPVAAGGLPQPEVFLGEQVISSSLLSLLEERPPRVYFLQGYGERDFDDHDDYVGLSKIGELVRRDYIELLPLDFNGRTSIPEDADALIIAGPARPYPQAILDRIANFAAREGSLLLMLNAETDAGLGELLAAWGIQSVNNIVVDPSRTVSGFDVLIPDYPDHPITRNLGNLTSMLYWPRALPILENGENVSAADKPRARPMILSSDRAWAERNLDQQPYVFDSATDLKGPLPLAVTSERGAEGSEALNLSLPRLAVFGDVDFVSNNGLSGANSDLFMNTLNWLLDRDRLLEIGSRPMNTVRLIIDRPAMAKLFWLIVVGIPLAAASTGLLVWWRRRA